MTASTGLLARLTSNKKQCPHCSPFERSDLNNTPELTFPPPLKWSDLNAASTADSEAASSSPEAPSSRPATCSGDHSYTVVSPRRDRMLLAASKRKLQKAKKILRQAKRKANRKGMKIKKLNALLKKLRAELPQPAVAILDNIFSGTLRDIRTSEMGSRDWREAGLHKGVLRKVSHEAQKGPLLISLMVDEISIKKQALQREDTYAGKNVRTIRLEAIRLSVADVYRRGRGSRQIQVVTDAYAPLSWPPLAGVADDDRRWWDATRN
ncbi:hypothetical protein HPB47_008685 [Ixodes persulcatus]|uniref:Uncharacterized protein n=1 Tax=Ixodes persulcatus TaxID=34615 RepID=A0AC60P4E2_IXOPE|nr:hypothetical protein HPB47_008685 [Ixodes persulcatus]